MTTPESDPLDELLSGPRLAADSERFRQAVLAETLSVLAGRRRIRRLVGILALTGCYLAGLSTTLLWRADAPPESSVAASHKASPPRPLAHQPAKSPYEALRDAGDRAWQHDGDIESAIRLYGRALGVGTPQELRVSAADDNWLLMYLKRAHEHEMENQHANDHGDS